jgi:hypothetical protein
MIRLQGNIMSWEYEIPEDHILFMNHFLKITALVQDKHHVLLSNHILFTI